MEEAREREMPVPTSVEWGTATPGGGDQADSQSGPVSPEPVRATYPTVFLGDGGELLLGAFEDAHSLVDAEIVAGTALHALAETLLRMRGCDRRRPQEPHSPVDRDVGRPRHGGALSSDETDIWTRS